MGWEALMPGARCEEAIESGMSLCGCNSVSPFLFAIISEYAKGHEGSRMVYFDELAKRLESSEREIELALQILDKAGLIEHGTAIRGSWLTKKGEGYARAILALEKGKEKP